MDWELRPGVQLHLAALVRADTQHLLCAVQCTCNQGSLLLSQAQCQDSGKDSLQNLTVLRFTPWHSAKIPCYPTPILTLSPPSVLCRWAGQALFGTLSTDVIILTLLYSWAGVRPGVLSSLNATNLYTELVVLQPQYCTLCCAQY